jgi:hypothetical protein
MASFSVPTSRWAASSSGPYLVAIDYADARRPWAASRIERIRESLLLQAGSGRSTP